MSRQTQHRDFFISYTKADHLWATGIKTWLEEEGFTVFMQDPDFHPGSNIVLKMHEGTSTCERTIAVVSPDYLQSDFTPSEWAAAFARDPKGENGTLVLVIVRATDLPGLLAPIRYINLVGINVDQARVKLLTDLNIPTKGTKTAKRHRPIPKQTEMKEPSVSIEVGRTGDNATIAGRDVIKTEKVTVRHEFTPGPQHITEKQAHQIQEKLRELAEIDEKAGKGETYGKWQNMFKNEFNLETYRALQSMHAEAAFSKLRQWKARARRSLRRTDNQSWRKEHYSAIYAKWYALGNQKEDIYPFAKKYLELKKPITSLTELKERQLEKLSTHVGRMS